MKAFNIGELIAGVGIFLIGIQMLESALKNMMGRPFKLFLKKQTGNPFKAIAGGTIITALLQSSSAVNFMVLAFVSTGVITMRNALAVIMGTNLGTTLDSWIIATAGFKVDIEAFAFPVVGIAGILLFIYGDKKRLSNILTFLIGFSFLFIGLGFMKEAFANDELESFISRFAGKSNLVFLLAGFIITTITQSSTATIAITLSILSSKLIGFESAIAIAIGSEVGTSIKLILGSLNGIAAKKRVAFGNLIYNIVTTIIGFSLLRQIAWFITDVMAIKDPLIGLVSFQTGINFLNIILFLPFLDPFSRLIERLFSEKDDHVSAFIHKIKPDEASTAVDLLKKESEFFVSRSVRFNLRSFDISSVDFILVEKYKSTEDKFHERSFDQQYNFLKQHQGEIQSFYIQLSKQSLNPELTVEAESCIDAVRSCLHSVKSIKDIHSDIYDLKNSSHDIKFSMYKNLKDQVEIIYKKINDAINLPEPVQIAEGLKAILDNIAGNYKSNLAQVYGDDSIDTISHEEIATLININRELFTSNKALVMCFKSLVLTADLEGHFSEIPTYLP